MEIKLGENLVVPEEGDDVQEVPITNNLPEDTKTEEKPQQVIDYSKYLGVLEIPKIGLKRGFYNIDSRYNDIQYNVTLAQGSSMPDVAKGNLILMAHSGDAAISYFAYLYILKIGDYAYVTYNGTKYTYQLINVYDVPKTGKVKIVRSYDETTLTLITCTKNNDQAQTVYILALV
jgi:LPXTG-site transpeptidase (sortase) family protein